MPIVTLLTDFGTEDAYVGSIKGVLLSLCPGVEIVDITHDVRPQDIRGGALRLASATRFFPRGAVHLAVVDPGVGSKRRPIAIATDEQRFVGPDNGLLSLAAPRDAAGWRAVELDRPDTWLSEISSTFHGRHIFAPIAARLAFGQPLEALGSRLDSIVELKIPSPARQEHEIVGSVIDVDRYGNLATNIRRDDLGGRGIQAVLVGEVRIVGLASWYDPAYSLVALFNSEGWLEIVAPLANAAERLAHGLDAEVRVQLTSGARHE